METNWVVRGLHEIDTLVKEKSEEKNHLVARSKSSCSSPCRRREIILLSQIVEHFVSTKGSCKTPFMTTLLSHWLTGSNGSYLSNRTLHPESHDFGSVRTHFWFDLFAIDIVV